MFTSVQPLQFRRFGSGPALVLLHGLGTPGEMYAPLWEQLATRHELLIPDLRGAGRSSQLPGPYSVEQHAADVAGLIEAEGLSPAGVVGVSQGGAVAQQLAWQHPGRVRRLVLVCTFACNLATPRERFEARLTPWLIRLIGPAGLARLAVRPGLFGGASMAPACARLLRRLLAANSRRQLIEAHQAMAVFDSRPWLDQIRQPTLIVSGSQDRAVPARHAQMLAQNIKGAEHREFEGAGHGLIYTHTRQFLDLLESWLAEPKDPAAGGDGPISSA